jgi:subtilase family serine protease
MKSAPFYVSKIKWLRDAAQTRYRISKEEPVISPRQHNSLRQLRCMFLAAAILTVGTRPTHAADDGRFIAQNTAGYVSTSNIVRAEDPSTMVEVSIWLNPHNRTELDALASDLYDRRSPNYRHWLKRSDIAARFAPTAAEAKTVRDFMESKNLKVTAIGPDNFYVRARGTAADVEHAFKVRLNYYQAGSQTLRSNASDPYVEGPAAELVQAISGLDSAKLQHPFELQPSGQALSSSSGPLSTYSANRADLTHASTASDTLGFETVCFPGPSTESFTTAGTYPTATYKGNVYRPGVAGCVYSPSNIYKAYNLKGLYAEGYTGTGQTIVIIDWCGSPTILQDANAFSHQFGLPALTSSNFSIIKTAASQCEAPDPEINLDVEWAHAIAPGASIDLVVPPTAELEDIDEAWLLAVNYAFGNVISGSYGAPEKQVGGTELAKENLIAEIGAISGISSNFATGDAGSYCHVFGVGCTVSIPAGLPYSTAVGGVSLALNSDSSIAFQTGWESYLSELISGDVIYDPPLANGENQYLYGSGGGASKFFPKPPFQKGVPGSFRQIPDIAWLADPFTAVAIVISEPDGYPEQVWTGIGGTSLAAPMFSALWAIANQEAGTALGQAAPYLYSMPAGTIRDVVPYTSSHDLTAVIHESSSVTHSYDAADTLVIEEPLFGEFYSAIVNVPLEQSTAVTLSFGQDYDLKVAVGWDDVTGLGTPNAKAFADSFAPASATK